MIELVPRIPENPIDLITASLRVREADRKRAVEIGWATLESAQSEAEVRGAINTIATMEDVLEGFRAQFPEVFLSQEPDKN